MTATATAIDMHSNVQMWKRWQPSVEQFSKSQCAKRGAFAFDSNRLWLFFSCDAQNNEWKKKNCSHRHRRHGWRKKKLIKTNKQSKAYEREPEKSQFTLSNFVSVVSTGETIVGTNRKTSDFGVFALFTCVRSTPYSLYFVWFFVPVKSQMPTPFCLFLFFGFFHCIAAISTLTWSQNHLHDLAKKPRTFFYVSFVVGGKPIFFISFFFGCLRRECVTNEVFSNNRQRMEMIFLFFILRFRFDSFWLESREKKYTEKPQERK